MSTDDHSTETWWIRDTSPEPNDTAPKKMCRVCMRHPVGVADRPDPDCQMCRGRGTMPDGPIEVAIHVEPENSWSDLAGSGSVPDRSGDSAVQISWNSGGFSAL